MGPLFFRAENSTETVYQFVWHLLQWGRSFSERRTLHSPAQIVGAELPSMGPLFFRAENMELEYVE